MDNEASLDIDIEALSEACYVGDTDTVNAIIATGTVDINGKDSDGYTPLHSAMVGNQVSTVGILLSEPSLHIDSKDDYNATPFHLGCAAGSLACVQLYIKDTRFTEQMLNVKSDGDTALMWAVLKGRLGVVKYLATVPGVDFNTRNKQGRTLVEVARDRKLKNVVRFLLGNSNTTEAEKVQEPIEEGVMSKNSLKKNRKKNKNKLRTNSGNDGLTSKDDEENGSFQFNNLSLKVRSVNSKDLEEFNDLVDDVIEKARKELEIKIAQIKCLKIEKEELINQLLHKNKKLSGLRNKTEKSIETKSADMLKITDKVTNFTSKKENNKKDIDEVIAQLRLLKRMKASLIDENKSIDAKISELETEKKSVQSDIEKQTAEFEVKESTLKKEVEIVEEKIKSVDIKIKTTKDYKGLENQTYKMVKFLDKQIETKQRDLECPVCLEVAKAPIYSCSESHLVCHLCIHNLKQCPVCRVEYKGEKKQHRYAERDAIELESLLLERENLNV